MNKKSEKVMRFESRKGQNEIFFEEKHVLKFLKTYFLYCCFLGMLL
jgi:hypothetical protein